MQKHKNSLTNGNLALRLFTDRNEFTCLFAKYLNHDPPYKKILFFHGEGGNGKSLLLKFLKEKCCKRFLPEVWERIRAISQDNIATAAVYIENAESHDYTPIPSAFLDFGQQPIGEDNPKDPFYGLLMLRRKIAAAASKLKYQIKFPLYDFACFWYLHQKGRSSQEIKRLFPSEEMELIGVVADFFAESVWGNLLRSLINTIAKSAGEKIIRLWKERGLDKEWVRNLMESDPDSELIEMLPEWFAQDLNAAMKGENAPPRLVLFFDTHEAFWGDERRHSQTLFFYQDKWLRRFLTELELSDGIVVVMAGREKPRWSEAVEFPIPGKYLDTQLVWHLSDKDAVVYLQNAGISDTALQKSLIRYASVAPDQVHPFYLGLCADLVLAARKQNKIFDSDDFANIPEISLKSKLLIERLLKYVDPEIRYAIEALSACRSFDFDLYQKLGNALHFHATIPAFQTLTRFSFVWEVKEHENQYRIHDLIRRIYDQERNQVTLRTHARLERYYRKRENITEAIYHAICQNQEQGRKELIKIFRQAKEERNLGLCRALKELREEISFYLDKWHRK